MKNVFIVAFLLSLFMASCSMPVRHKTQPMVVVVGEATLIPGKTELNDHRAVYRFPFTIESAQHDASLTLDFIVSDKGHCPVSYIPTTISVNSRQLKEIDFRDYSYASRQVVTIPISRSVLVAGDNLVEIRTGECDFDIDVMSLNDMRINIKK